MTAPTTAEVREAVEQAALAQETLSPSMPAATVFFAVGAVLEDVALPLAEHRDAAVAERDALAAEVARLREALAASEARAKKAGEGAAWVIARCKEALKLPACARNVRERQALGDVLAYTSAAKGAGR